MKPGQKVERYEAKLKWVYAVYSPFQASSALDIVDMIHSSVE